MPEGFYTIVVVCDHIGRASAGKRRVISRLKWLETDPEEEQAMRDGRKERGGTFSEEAFQVILLNDRFSRREEWKNRAGRTVRPPDTHRTYWAGDEESGRAGALGAFRFRCHCGIDRPSRQSSLDTWIRREIDADPNRRRFVFEISA